MGYCMQMIEQDFFIPADKVPKVIDAIRRLGGGETTRDSTGAHYSWVQRDFARRDTVPEMMSAWRWEVETEDGNIVSIEFCGEKLGDDHILFEAIAPFVKAGSYIEMSGEDGTRWRWVFDGKTCVEKTATISWE